MLIVKLHQTHKYVYCASADTCGFHRVDVTKLWAFLIVDKTGWIQIKQQPQNL